MFADINILLLHIFLSFRMWSRSLTMFRRKLLPLMIRIYQAVLPRRQQSSQQLPQELRMSGLYHQDVD